MRVKPIIFNTQMVQAILSGEKHYTRRVIKYDTKSLLSSPYHESHPEVSDKHIVGKLCIPPYRVGDILYVRESFNPGEQRILYRADCPNAKDLKWTPAIYMPKTAARLWLKVTSIRVERLREITEDGAIAEGMQGNTSPQDKQIPAVERFSSLWDTTISKSVLDQYGWLANPWVWVIGFKVTQKPSS